MNKTLLIVDDLEINREIIRVMFENKYNVIEAKNGEECIEIAKTENDIALVLLDIRMTGVTGFEILKMKKEGKIFNEIPVIMLTACDDPTYQVEAFKLGAVDYITKPFIKEIVEYRVENAIMLNEQVKKAKEEKESFQIKSETDLMTGLLNKVTTEAKINKELKKGVGKNHILFLFDIDNFKHVNDTYGHTAGDDTITGIANIVAKEFGEADIVGRIGGDEFVAFIKDVNDMNFVRKIADNIINSLNLRENDAIPAETTLSIGISYTAGHISDFKQMFEAADKALYDVKGNGKNGYNILRIN